MGKITSHSPLFNDYNTFVEKFKPKKTTDDCYTPPAVYDAVLEYAKKLPRFPKGANVLRPFYPGGDYQGVEYKPGDVVVDNPPFSIVTQIINFYTERGVPFFLFAPGTTLGGCVKDREGVTGIIIGTRIIYENGALVNTAFVTNMDDPNVRLRCAPALSTAIREACRKSKAPGKQQRRLSWPPHVTTAALLQKIAAVGIPLSIRRADCVYIAGKLDCGANLYGGGYLLSEKAAAEKAAAEKAAAEKVAAEKAAAEKAAAEKVAAEKIILSERELQIINNLGNRE